MPWWPLPPEDDTVSATWYSDGLMPWPEPDATVRVRSFVPSGFEAYVEIEHPEVEGEMPLKVAWKLADVLPHHTTTPDRVFYAAWEGAYPATHPAFSSMPRLVAQKRNYLVFVGDREGALVGLPDDVSGSWPLIINAWWPDDHAWCVVTEIDSRSTYVGCSNTCAQVLLADDSLGAKPASLLDRVDDEGRRLARELGQA